MEYSQHGIANVYSMFLVLFHSNSFAVDAVSAMAEKHQPEADAAMARAKDRIAVLVTAKEAVKEGKANWMSQPSSSLFSPASQP